MSEPVKLCIECEHHKRIDTGAFELRHVCAEEKLVDVVDGQPVYRRCEFVRGKEGRCGIEGKLHKPKPWIANSQ